MSDISYEELAAQFGRLSPTYVLASEVPRVHGISKDDLECVKKVSWEDEGETWALYLNGSGQHWRPVVSPQGGEFPDPAAVEVDAGSHLVQLNDEAIAILRPDGPEFFVDKEATKIWESAILYAVRDHMVDHGEDLPPVSELVEEVDSA